MHVDGIGPLSPYRGEILFRPTTETSRPSPSRSEELILKALDQTEISVLKLRDNYQKAVT